MMCVGSTLHRYCRKNYDMDKEDSREVSCIYVLYSRTKTNNKFSLRSLISRYPSKTLNANKLYMNCSYISVN